jgi:ribosomal protein S12 methylthiotransferase accessory factor
MARELGVVRPANVTGLDRLGVPCWQAFRPAAADVPGNITVFNGKGWSHQQAELGALVEGIERHFGEGPQLSAVARPDGPLHRIASRDELERQGVAFVDPSAVPLPVGIAAPERDRPLLWVQGHTGEREIWIGAHEVYSPYLCPEGVVDPGVWRSTGLAAGSDRAEAAFYGLLEVIERDADAVAQFRRNPCSDLHIEQLATPRLKKLCLRLQAERITLRVKTLPALGGLSAFAATLDDTELRDPMLLNMGTAAHVDPVLALESAVLEAVQSRATIIAGGREDMDCEQRDAAAYDGARERCGRWFQTHCLRAYEPHASPYEGLSPAHAFAAIAERIGRHGFTTVTVPLTPAGAPIAVVKVVVAGCSEVGAHGSVRLGRRFAVSRSSSESSL